MDAGRQGGGGYPRSHQTGAGGPVPSQLRAQTQPAGVHHPEILSPPDSESCLERGQDLNNEEEGVKSANWLAVGEADERRKRVNDIYFTRRGRVSGRKCVKFFWSILLLRPFKTELVVFDLYS